MKAGWKAGKEVKHLDKFLKAFAKQLRTEKMLEQLITSQFVRRSVSSSILERVDLKTVCQYLCCLLYTSPSPRDQRGSRMPSSA